VDPRCFFAFHAVDMAEEVVKYVRVFDSKWARTRDFMYLDNVPRVRNTPGVRS